MQIKIIEKHFGGVEFTPEMRVLHLGGQSSANVERLEFQLPESWQGKSVTLHIQRQDGTMPSALVARLKAADQRSCEQDRSRKKPSQAWTPKSWLPTSPPEDPPGGAATDVPGDGDWTF